MYDDVYIGDIQRITLNVSCITISGGRTKQLDIFCCVTGFMSEFRPPQTSASGMTISGERTEQHLVIGFGELAAVD